MDPGNPATIIANIELPPGVHVYSPGVQGYKPTQLILHPESGVEFSPVTYPNSKTLYLEEIKEKVPVFEGKFRITQDVTVNASKARDGLRAVLSAGNKVSVVGDLQYQACDQAVCYTPRSVPVKWELQVRPLHLKRAPENIQHK